MNVRKVRRGPAKASWLVILSLMLVGACGGDNGGDTGGAGAEAEADAETYKMRIGNQTSGDIQEELGQMFVDRINQESDGRIEAEYFTGGTLGDNVEMLQSMQTGGLEGGIAPTAWMSSFVPELGVLSLPFLYPGEGIEENVQNIGAMLNDGEAGKYIKDAAQKKGFKVISLFGIGPEVIFSNEPVKSMEDLRGNSYRALPGDVHINTFQDWGAVGSPVPFGEVYTSVQQGVIDGGENPPDVLFKSRFHEVGPNIALTYHNSLVSYITVSQEWYESLPADLQQLIDDVGADMVADGGNKYAEAQVTSLDELEENESVTVTEFPQADLDEMKRLNEAGVWKQVQSDPVQGPVVELLLKDREALQ